MGIYDEGSERWTRVILAFLTFVTTILYLPSPYGVDVRADRVPLVPGERAVLWVEVTNRTAHPLSGAFVVVYNPELNLDRYITFPEIPPGGRSLDRIEVNVPDSVIHGDLLIRVFLSVPGSTQVKYVRVRTG